MIEIKILGTGCPDCLRLWERVMEVLRERGLEQVVVEIVSDRHLADYGLSPAQAPGLLIDGCLAWAGSVPTREQVQEWVCLALTPTII